MKTSKTFASIFAMGLLGAVGISTQAAAITVDGNLIDWNGASVGDNNTSNFVTAGGTPGFSSMIIEDDNDNSNSYAHDNNSALGGGQNYDVEFMATAIQGTGANTKIYIAISTGIRPDNGSPGGTARHFGLGDLMIFHAASNTWFGIETGGGYDPSGAAIQNGSDGTTYTGDSQGHATGELAQGSTAVTLNGDGSLTGGEHNSAQKAGTIWKNVFRIGDPIPNTTDHETRYTQFSTNNGGATQIGTALYYNTMDTITNQHAVMEFEILVSDLLAAGINEGDQLAISFSAICGNDLETVVVVPEQHDVNVPSPAALPLFLLGLGALGLGGYRRRRAA